MGSVTRRLAVATLAAVVAGGLTSWQPFSPDVWFSGPVVAQAHCPGTPANQRAHYTAETSSLKNGVKGSIQWTQGNVCTSGVSHWVNLCSSSCAYWVQAGWRYYSWHSEPKGYCEWNGTHYRLREFTISHATHVYRQQYDSLDKDWDCYVDSTLMFSRGLEDIGMSAGTWFRSAGENHQKHVQIGKMAPDTLSLSYLRWRINSTGNWDLVNGTADVEGGPYGAEETQSGFLKVWTDAH